MSDADAIHYTGYAILAIGLLASILTCKLIVCTVTKKRVNPVQQQIMMASIMPLIVKMMPSILAKQLVSVVFLLVTIM